ncbi:putative holin-like toxin [Gottfriedia acidiceleris]|uniref:putative holin-like toxin n=1 Tax=Gottfriedia acidiceleris TaxID=371036 RepID=UPI003B58A627
MYRTNLDPGRLKSKEAVSIVTFEVLSLMISFGMFVIAILEFKDKDKNKNS